jgi:hypothetical protein
LILKGTQLPMSRNQQLILLLFIYVFSIFAFAAFYMLHYRRDPECFAFVSGLTQVRTREAVQEAEDDLCQDRTVFGSERELRDSLAAGSPIFASERGDALGRLETAGWSYRLETTRVQDTKDDFHETIFVRIEARAHDSNSNWSREILGVSRHLNIGTDPDDPLLQGLERHDGKVLLHLVEARLVPEAQQRVAQDSLKLRELVGHARAPWSYWDFVYFSTVTQTTVGFGDILPNSTGVRMLVVVQVLVGVALIGIFVNLRFLPRPTAGSR